MFKTQHPADLVSRMFILEYMRELGAETLYEKASPEQKKNMFYKFSDDDGNISVDLNWEALLFECTILQLEGLVKHFVKEIEKIEEARQELYKKKAAQRIEEELKQPVDINLMDFAAAKIKENKDNNKLIM